MDEKRTWQPSGARPPLGASAYKLSALAQQVPIVDVNAATRRASLSKSDAEETANPVMYDADEDDDDDEDDAGMSWTIPIKDMRNGAGSRLSIGSGNGPDAADTGRRFGNPAEFLLPRPSPPKNASPHRSSTPSPRDVDAAIDAIQGSHAPAASFEAAPAPAPERQPVDEEFGYALEGGVRDAEFSRQEYRAEALPEHMVTNVKTLARLGVYEEDEEEDESRLPAAVGDESSPQSTSSSASSSAIPPHEASFATPQMRQHANERSLHQRAPSAPEHAMVDFVSRITREAQREPDSAVGLSPHPPPSGDAVPDALARLSAAARMQVTTGVLGAGHGSRLDRPVAPIIAPVPNRTVTTGQMVTTGRVHSLPTTLDNINGEMLAAQKAAFMQSPNSYAPDARIGGQALHVGLADGINQSEEDAFLEHLRRQGKLTSQYTNHLFGPPETSPRLPGDMMALRGAHTLPRPRSAGPPGLVPLRTNSAAALHLFPEALTPGRRPLSTSAAPLFASNAHDLGLPHTSASMRPHSATDHRLPSVRAPQSPPSLSPHAPLLDLHGRSPAYSVAVYTGAVPAGGSATSMAADPRRLHSDHAVVARSRLDAGGDNAFQFTALPEHATKLDPARGIPTSPEPVGKRLASNSTGAPHELISLSEPGVRAAPLSHGVDLFRDNISAGVLTSDAPYQPTPAQQAALLSQTVTADKGADEDEEECRQKSMQRVEAWLSEAADPSGAPRGPPGADWQDDGQQRDEAPDALAAAASARAATAARVPPPGGWDADDGPVATPRDADMQLSASLRMTAVGASASPMHLTPKDDGPTLDLTKSGKGTQSQQRRSITCGDILIYFMTCNLDMSNVVAHASDDMGGFCGLCRVFSQPKALPKGLEQQRLRLLGLAKLQMDNANEMHELLLLSVFRCFVGSPCPQRYGPHWEVLGFQGSDPATDTRGAGMLGLIHLLQLYMHSKRNADLLFALSQDPVQEFPLALIGINISMWTVEMARSGELNSVAIRRSSLTQTALEFYIGSFYNFYLRWVQKKHTMANSGEVLANLKAYAKKNASTMVSHASLLLTRPDGKSS